MKVSIKVNRAYLNLSYHPSLTPDTYFSARAIAAITF